MPELPIQPPTTQPQLFPFPVLLVASEPQPEPTLDQMPLQISVTPGELYDRLLILELKLQRVSDKTKRQQVQAAYIRLSRESVLPLFKLYTALTDEQAAEINELVAKLREVHQQLWDVEDILRACERIREFSFSAFVTPARAVYRLNDQRSEIKNRIDELFGYQGEVKDFPRAEQIEEVYTPGHEEAVG